MSNQRITVGETTCEVLGLPGAGGTSVEVESPVLELLRRSFLDAGTLDHARGHIVILCADIDAPNLLFAIGNASPDSVGVHRTASGRVSFLVLGSAIVANPMLPKLVAYAHELAFDDDHVLDLISRIVLPAFQTRESAPAREMQIDPVAQESDCALQPAPEGESGEADYAATQDSQVVTQAVVEASGAVDLAVAGVPGAEDQATQDTASTPEDPVRSAFDASFYTQAYSEFLSAEDDPFEHYMTIGWKQGLDPSPVFSSSFYLESNPDIAAAGVNPLEHWVHYGRSEMRRHARFRQRVNLRTARPKVSAIVPNFNHGAYLEERIHSILNQTYDNIDILILDDCSSDNSREVVNGFVERYPDRIRTIFNEVNSGSVFRQWRRGVESTDGEIVWICESDDFCEPDFVENLVKYFKDDSVSIAFGRIQDTDEHGVFRGTLDAFREGAEAGIWGEPVVRPAAAWFANGFGVNNVIANVGGCLWRRSHISEATWREAETFKVVGDWFLYIEIARGGQIAFEPKAIAYFRRHDDSTSFKSYVRPFFYEELERLMLSLRSKWDIPTQTVAKFHGKVAELYEMFHLEAEYGPLEKYCDLGKLMAVERCRPHVLIAFYGFIPGGGESFPIHLASGLYRAGWLVSALIFEGDDVNAAMRASLDPGIAVYDSTWVDEYGADKFLRDAGIDIIHSHNITSEIAFYDTWKISHPVGYLATLHGSYEAHGLTDEMLAALDAHVNHFVYTADKNLGPLDPLGLPGSRTSKLANSMPIDPEPFLQTRAELGIVEDAVVFTLVARGVLRKGWRASILAFLEVRKRNPGKAMHLLLCGTGELPDLLEPIYGGDPDITFLGFQSRIHGLYRLTDVAIVPTRFAGESFPLCIIQALQVGAPVISTRVGEIPYMLTDAEGKVAGILIDAPRETDRFVEHLADAMEHMLDPVARSEAAQTASTLGEGYDMEKLVETYGHLFNGILAEEQDKASRWASNDIGA